MSFISSDYFAIRSSTLALAMACLAAGAIEASAAEPAKQANLPAGIMVSASSEEMASKLRSSLKTDATHVKLDTSSIEYSVVKGGFLGIGRGPVNQANTNMRADISRADGSVRLIYTYYSGAADVLETLYLHSPAGRIYSPLRLISKTSRYVPVTTSRSCNAGTCMTTQAGGYTTYSGRYETEIPLSYLETFVDAAGGTATDAVLFNTVYEAEIPTKNDYPDAILYRSQASALLSAIRAERENILKKRQPGMAAAGLPSVQVASLQPIAPLVVESDPLVAVASSNPSNGSSVTLLMPSALLVLGVATPNQGPQAQPLQAASVQVPAPVARIATLMPAALQAGVGSSSPSGAVPAAAAAQLPAQGGVLPTTLAPPPPPVVEMPKELAANSEILVTPLQPILTKRLIVDTKLIFETMADVKLGDKVLIPAKTPVSGIVASVSKAGAFGRAGNLGIRFDSLQLASGTVVQLKGTHSQAGQRADATAGSNLAQTGAAIAGLGAIGALAGLFGGALVSGSSAKLYPGNKLSAFTVDALVLDSTGNVVMVTKTEVPAGAAAAGTISLPTTPPAK